MSGFACEFDHLYQFRDYALIIEYGINNRYIDPIAILGAVSGCISLAILIYKQLVKERPIFIYKIENVYWSPPLITIQSTI